MEECHSSEVAAGMEANAKPKESRCAVEVQHRRMSWYFASVTFGMSSIARKLENRGSWLGGDCSPERQRWP